MIAKEAKMTAIAVVQEADGWWIVTRSIGSEGGVISDEKLEGPFAIESKAEQRASEIAMAKGQALKDAKSGERRAKQAMGRKASKAGMDAMIRLLTRQME